MDKLFGEGDRSDRTWRMKAMVFIAAAYCISSALRPISLYSHNNFRAF